jgi:hypothetical protein
MPRAIGGGLGRNTNIAVRASDLKAWFPTRRTGPGVSWKLAANTGRRTKLKKADAASNGEG